MKTLLLNDTRSAQHVGCELVMDNSLEACAQVGLEVVGTVTTAEAKETLIPRLESITFDLLLVNGEGSMHHDRPVPSHLCEAAEWAKREGKRTVLYNTLWEANERLNASLPAFDQIYCRDSVSADAVRAAGATAVVVPDMIFASQFEKSTRHRSRNDWTILDSIDRKRSAALSKLASRYVFPFLHMDRIAFERLKKRLFVRTGWFDWEHEGVPIFIETLQFSDHVLSGRFHGTCLAMILGVPVLSVRSNTAKLETLHRDAGLDPDLVFSEVPKRMAALEERAGLAEQAVPKAQAYVSEAREAIGSMFAEIAKA